MDSETKHPDAAWLAGIQEAVNAWLAVPSLSPTSQITGGGAVRAAEDLFSRFHSARPALLVPSASYGMRLALQALGAGPGDLVLVPALDWPSTYAAVTSLGAVPVPVVVNETTLTIDPTAARRARTPAVKAVVACHLHGVCADVPALAAALPGVPVVEDCAQAFGATLDGTRAGCLGEVAIFSAGPGKILDAGEAGIVLARDPILMDRLIGLGTHPVRQLLTGHDTLETGNFSLRVHPLAAVQLWHRLSGMSDNPPAAIDERRTTLSQWIPAGLLEATTSPGTDRSETRNSSAQIITPAGAIPRKPPARLRHRSAAG